VRQSLNIELMDQVFNKPLIADVIYLLSGYSIFYNWRGMVV